MNDIESTAKRDAARAMAATTDSELVDKYDQVYAGGEEKFWTVLPIEERLCFLKTIDFQDKTVLEIGCGTGDFAAWMATAGAKSVDGYDLSKNAVHEAINKYGYLGNVGFYDKDPLHYSFPLSEIREYDVIILLGVLEHVENPEKALDTIRERFMGPASILAVSCPYHCNPRGYIWLALQYLFNVPMSLTDKHELDPPWFAAWAKDRNMALADVATVDIDWARGETMIRDLERRLPKALLDYWQNMSTEIERLPDWQTDGIEKLLKYLRNNLKLHEGKGANACYFLRKQPRNVNR